MKAFAIARTNLIRFFKDRSSIFQTFVLPVVLILLLGGASGGSSLPKVGFVAAEPDALVTQLQEGLAGTGSFELVEFDSRDDAVRAVERGELQGVLIVPNGYEATLRSGANAELEFVGKASDQLGGAGAIVESVVTQQATLLRAARFAEERGFATFDVALLAAEELQTTMPPVAVEVSSTGEPWKLGGLGQFDVAAQTMLILFMFMTTLLGASAIVQSRRLGVTQRMLSTPTAARTVILGEGLSRFIIGLIQGAFIFLGTWLVFDVAWGAPLAAVTIVVIFAVVSSGAAMLLGALVNNDQQAGSIGVVLGLGLAALGGAMYPLAVLEVLSDTVYRVAHVTPHAWALEAFEELTAFGGGFGDVALFLAILVGYALVFYALAIWRLKTVMRRSAHG